MHSSLKLFLRLLLPVALLGVLGCEVRVQPLGFGSGTVTIEPGGIVCTVSTGVGDANCTNDFDDDQVVTLTATAADGSVFTEWSGSCQSVVDNVCTTTADQLRVVLAGFEPDSIPAAPSDLDAQAVSTFQINLSWTDNANNEAGYFVERCTGEDCSNFSIIAQLGANTTSYQDTSLSADTTYRYRVNSGNTLGFSGYVTSGNVTTDEP